VACAAVGVGSRRFIACVFEFDAINVVDLAYVEDFGNDSGFD
jgi:hypothetical protein